MGFFSRKATPTTTQVVLDIADDSIGAALVTADGSTPQVLWFDRERLPITTTQDADHHQRDTLKAINTLLERLHRQFRREFVDEVLCVFSGRWQIDDVVSVRLQQPEAFTVSGDHIDAAHRAAHRQFRRSGRLAASGHEPAGLTHLDHRLVGLHADGQRLANPHGHRCRDLEARIYISKMPTTTRRSFEQTITGSFHPDKLTFCTAADISTQILSELFSYPQDFIMVTPGRHQTDTALVADGQINKLTSHGIGEDFVVRALAAALDHSPQEVQSRLMLHQRGKTHPEYSREMSIALETLAQRWAEALFSQLESTSGGELPAHIYLVAPDGQAGELFKRFLAQAIQEREHPLRVHVVGSSLFAEHIMSDEPVDHRLAFGVLAAVGF